MTIKLISKEDYNIIVKIQKQFEFLTFEQIGYGYPRRPETEEEKQALDTVNNILKDSIVGFSKFNNFNVRPEGIRLRFQYHWDADNEDTDNKNPFIGVGYLWLEELLNGFSEKLPKNG